MVKKKRDEDKKLKITLTVDKEIFNKFREQCEEDGMKISSRVSKLMEKDLR